MVGWPYCDHGYGIGWNRKLPSKTRWASTELIDFLGWYAIFEPEPCLSPNQISASIVISISISASTFAYFYLHVSIYIDQSIQAYVCNILLTSYIYLSISIYLLLVASIYICLLLFTSIYYIDQSIQAYVCNILLTSTYVSWCTTHLWIDGFIDPFTYRNIFIHIWNKTNVRYATVRMVT